MNFKKQVKPKNQETKKQKEDVFNAFDIKIFSIKTEDTDFSDKVSDHSNLKLLTPNQIFQRSPIALAQFKAGKTSENLLNEIRKITYSLYGAKEITKIVYKNIMNSIKV